MLLCFILMRGKQNYFYDIPVCKRDISEKIFLSDIMQLFNALYCPGLVLRPKLFFVQVYIYYALDL